MKQSQIQKDVAGQQKQQQQQLQQQPVYPDLSGFGRGGTVRVERVTVCAPCHTVGLTLS